MITENLHRADEVVLVLGKTKTSAGGEVRSHMACPHRLCVVKALARLCSKLDMTQSEKPLFAWKQGSRRAGEGARYCDAMKMLKAAAESCGRKAADYGTHSLRRGGACQYLMAGASFSDTKMFGRWRSDAAAWGYMESKAGLLMRGLESAVCQGEERVRLMQREEPSREHLRKLRLRQQLKKMSEPSGEL